MVFDSEKTISQIFLIFCEDTNLETFDIIPQPKEKNESPVRHMEHNLGLESWCIKPLYIFAHRQILIRPSVVENKAALLTTALLLNPNSKTFWNMRRNLVLSYDLDAYSELRFDALVITFKPKVPDVFNYRKWLLRQIFEKNDIRADLLSNEFKVVLNAAERFPNNHMAWDFAVWLLNWIKLDKTPHKVLEYFWDESEKWISCNVSDYSAMNFRQQLIKHLLDFEHILDSQFKRRMSKIFYRFLSNISNLSKNDLDEKNVEIFFKFGIITTDLELNEKLICFYVNHEALWNHRRYLCYFLMNILPQKFKQNHQETVEILNELFRSEVENISNPLYFIFLKIHELFLSKVFINNHERFIRSYQKWLQYLNILNDETSHPLKKL